MRNALKVRIRSTLVLGLLAGAMLVLCGAAAQASVKDEAPYFELPDIDGRTVSLDDALERGPVILHFWATWCKPCLKEMSELQELHGEYGSRGLTVLAVSIDGPQSMSRVSSTVRSKGYTFDVLLDPGQSVARKYGVTSIPRTVLIGRDRIISLAVTGYRTGNRVSLESGVGKLLGTRAQSSPESSPEPDDIDIPRLMKWTQTLGEAEQDELMAQFMRLSGQERDEFVRRLWNRMSDEENRSPGPEDAREPALPGSGYVRPEFPPDVVITDLTFSEPSGNGALDAFESAEIGLVLENRGRGRAQYVRVENTMESPVNGLLTGPAAVVDELLPGEARSIVMGVSGTGDLVDTEAARMRIDVTEHLGFDAAPAVVQFDTRAYASPDLHIEQVAIDDSPGANSYGDGDSIIEPGESIQVTAYVQNLGRGEAEDIRATVSLAAADPHLNCPSCGGWLRLGRVEPGGYVPLEFYFYTSRRYESESVSFKVELEEANGRYDTTADLTFTMGAISPQIVGLEVESSSREDWEIEQVPQTSESDVDRPPPRTAPPNTNALAVIIGVEDYRYAPPVRFAERDAAAVRATAGEFLGIPRERIYYVTNDDATKGEFEKLFGAGGWLARRATPESEIYVYYSGHGAPDFKTGEAYLIPYDVDPNYADRGYPLSALYEDLAAIDAGHVTVMLDACFAGLGRGDVPILEDTRPVVLEVDVPRAGQGLTVFAATNQAQVSSGSERERHGLFTYHVLKGLHGSADADGDGRLTVGELHGYVRDNVWREAGLIDREQEPTLVSGDVARVLVEYGR